MTVFLAGRRTHNVLCRYVLCLMMIMAGAGFSGCSYDSTQALLGRDVSAGGGQGNSSVMTMMRVASAAHDAGNFSVAINLYRRAHTIAPLEIEPLLRLGAVLVDAGAPNDAAEAYRAALTQKPFEQRALRGLGTALLALGQPEMAAAQYRAALSEEKTASNYLGLGVSLDMSGNHHTARQAYLNALNLDPDNPILLNNLALSLAFDGQFESALSYLLPLVDSPHATVQHRQNLALIYGLANRMRDAARVARIDLDEDSVQRNLAYYELLRGLDRTAQRVAAIGIQRAQSNPYVLSQPVNH